MTHRRCCIAWHSTCSTTSMATMARCRLLRLLCGAACLLLTTSTAPAPQPRDSDGGRDYRELPQAAPIVGHEGLYIVRVDPETAPRRARALSPCGGVAHFDGGEQGWARAGLDAAHGEAFTAEHLVHGLFARASCRRRLETGLSTDSSAAPPGYSIPYSFQHPGLAKRLVLLQASQGQEGHVTAVLRDGVNDGVLLSFHASLEQQGSVASFGDRVDLECEEGGIGGSGAGLGMAGQGQGQGQGLGYSNANATTSQGSSGSTDRPSVVTESPVRNWGLDRLDQRSPTLDGTFSFPAAGQGQGVDIYVVDTGVNGQHLEFEAQASGSQGSDNDGTGNGAAGTDSSGNNNTDIPTGTLPKDEEVPSSSVPIVPIPVPLANSRVLASLGTNVLDDQNATDTVDKCHGHGTMVASLVAGKSVGVARSSYIIPVRVIYCNGRFMVADVLKGLDWAMVTAGKRRAEGGRRAIINLSARCFGVCSPLDDAADAAIEAGLLFTTVAGNEAKDACLTSPSRSKSAIAVGATRQAASTLDGDEWSSFSNWGPCVAMSAPGQMLYGANYRGPAQYSFWSGTSFATPLVAGVAAALWSQLPAASPQCLTDLVLSVATTGTVRFDAVPEANSNGTNTTNRFLYAPPFPLSILGRPTDGAAGSSGLDASVANDASVFGVAAGFFPHAEDNTNSSAGATTQALDGIVQQFNWPASCRAGTGGDGSTTYDVLSTHVSVGTTANGSSSDPTIMTDARRPPLSPVPSIATTNGPTTSSSSSDQPGDPVRVLEDLTCRPKYVAGGGGGGITAGTGGLAWDCSKQKAWRPGQQQQPDSSSPQQPLGPEPSPDPSPTFTIDQPSLPLGPGSDDSTRHPEDDGTHAAGSTGKQHPLTGQSKPTTDRGAAYYRHAALPLGAVSFHVDLMLDVETVVGRARSLMGILVALAHSSNTMTNGTADVASAAAAVGLPELAAPVLLDLGLAVSSLRSCIAWQAAAHTSDVAVTSIEACWPASEAVSSYSDALGASNNSTHRCLRLPLHVAHAINAGVDWSRATRWAGEALQGLGQIDANALEISLDALSAFAAQAVQAVQTGLPTSTVQPSEFWSHVWEGLPGLLEPHGLPMDGMGWIRVHLTALTLDPVGSALFLQSAHGQSLLGSWAGAHGQGLAKALGLRAVVVPKSGVRWITG